MIASATAIASGLAAASLLLVVFGAIGTLDAAGSAVLVVHFRHAIHHEAISDRHERLALVAIAAGMGVVAMAATAASINRLVDHGHVGDSAVGTAIAALSVVALSVLARGKAHVGRTVGSRALIADAHVSLIGAVLALFTTTGTVVTAAFDWWWLDPWGSLLVALVAFGVAASHARGALS